MFSNYWDYGFSFFFFGSSWPDICILPFFFRNETGTGNTWTGSSIYNHFFFLVQLQVHPQLPCYDFATTVFFFFKPEFLFFFLKMEEFTINGFFFFYCKLFFARIKIIPFALDNRWSLFFFLLQFHRDNLRHLSQFPDVELPRGF